MAEVHWKQNRHSNGLAVQLGWNEAEVARARDRRGVEGGILAGLFHSRGVRHCLPGRIDIEPQRDIALESASVERAGIMKWQVAIHHDRRVLGLFEKGGGVHPGGP